MGDVEEEVAEMQVVRYLTRLMGHRISTWLMYSHSLPGLLFGLVHPSEANVKEVLRTLSVWWTVWQDAEASSHGSKFTKD